MKSRQEAKKSDLEQNPAIESGEWVENQSPDTLDLADRAARVLQGMAGVLDPQAGFEFWWWVHYHTNPAYMAKDERSFSGCGPKMLDAMVMMTVMAGGKYFVEPLTGLKNLLVSWIDEDGLMFVPVGKTRPWDKACPEDYVNVAGQARMMLALMTLGQIDGQPGWMELAGAMAAGLERIAIHKKDYAYFPANPGTGGIEVQEGYCYPRSGWYDTTEAKSEVEGREESMFMYHCWPIRALTRWFKVSGNEPAIRLAEKLVRYVMQEKYWGTKQSWPHVCEPHEQCAVQGWKIITPERGHFEGHFHGHAGLLFALIEYAEAVNDKHLKEYVRAGYEYARNLGVSRIGLFGETCTISDMTAVAVKLSEAGVGDYWDDVDGYVRNQLVENQLIDAEELARVSALGEPPKLDYPHVSTDDVIEKTTGIFANHGDLDQIPITRSAQCCTANASQALYFAWESILRQPQPGHVQINLLLNRVSPWMNIDSYLPYEGRMVLKNKTARSVAVRIPNWVDWSRIVCRIQGISRNWVRAGNYALLDNLKEGDEITITFPMNEEKVSYTVLTGQQWSFDPQKDKFPKAEALRYTCHFKGNTLVDFSPRPDGRWYRTYRRDFYRGSAGPMKKVTRFVASKFPEW